MTKEKLIIWANIIFGVGLELLGAYVVTYHFYLWPFAVILTLIGAGIAYGGLDTRKRLKIRRSGETADKVSK